MGRRADRETLVGEANFGGDSELLLPVECRV